jgi:hypothetical protein
MLKAEIAKTLLDQLSPSQAKDLREFAKIVKEDPDFVVAHGWEGIAEFFKKRWNRERLAAKTLRVNVGRINEP